MAFAPQQRFLRSRPGRGLSLYLAFALLMSLAVAFGFYHASLVWFVRHKRDETVTALRLVDAFVQTYSETRATLGSGAPVPARFRAGAIAKFGALEAGQDGQFRLRWVGRADRYIATPPSDPAMANTIEAMAREAKPAPSSGFITLGGARFFRTIYPSIAAEKSCVDCHNAVAPGQHWRLGQLMGAFAIDVAADRFISSSRMEAGGLGAGLLLALGAVGLWVARQQFRQELARASVEESLRRSEERFRDYAAAASDWLWEQDETLRFIYTSPGAPQAAASIIGKTRREVVAPGDTLSLSEAQLRAHEDDLEARRPFQNLRLQQLTPAGDVRHVSLSGRPVFDTDGRFRGYRGIGRDVTAEVAVEVELGRRVEERTLELREIQGELVRREKFSALGQLTATVAHELRNPLSAIRNTVFALRELLSRSGIEVERPLSRVERNIERCDHIITDLLDFTRMPALNRAPIEADRWIEEIAGELQLPAGVSLVSALGAPQALVGFDAERMRRVVVNLIENAAQAMSDRGGRITLETRVAGRVYVLAVADDGPGIPEDVLPKVFEPLFSTKSFGTGLGLPTVKQIVEQHGGSVEIASQAGKGTRVVVRLPGVAEKEMAA